jgi:hypothetical protein
MGGSIATLRREKDAGKMSRQKARTVRFSVAFRLEFCLASARGGSCMDVLIFQCFSERKDHD